jgi:hypothetical protein
MVDGFIAIFVFWVLSFKVSFGYYMNHVRTPIFDWVHDTCRSFGYHPIILCSEVKVRFALLGREAGHL